MESKFENGNYEVIYKKLDDTLINDIVFEQKFKIKFFENGDTLRKGKFINDIALGKHSFYEDKKLYCVRNYVLFDDFMIDLINNIDSTNIVTYGIRRDSTYLNDAVFYNKNGDSLPNKSHFYTADLNQKTYQVGDSIISNFKFYYPNLKVYRTNAYYKVPTDTSLVTMSLNNFQDSHRYSNKIESNEFNRIEGLVDIFVLNEQLTTEGKQTYSKRLMLIEKEFVVNN